VVEPGLDAFRAEYEAGRAVVLRARLVADLETPVAAFIKLRAGRAGAAFLLESVEGGAVRGRYSIIGLDPDLVWRCRDGHAEIDRDALGREGNFEADGRPPLESLRALIAESAIPLGPDMPPMAAGLFGYLGYDMVRQMERLGPSQPRCPGRARRHHGSAHRRRGVRRGSRRTLPARPRAPEGRRERPLGL
jgi:anthranilate synthase component 1